MLLFVKESFWSAGSNVCHLIPTFCLTSFSTTLWKEMKGIERSYCKTTGWIRKGVFCFSKKNLKEHWSLAFFVFLWCFFLQRSEQSGSFFHKRGYWFDPSYIYWLFVQVLLSFCPFNRYMVSHKQLPWLPLSSLVFLHTHSFLFAHSQASQGSTWL